MLDSLYPRNTVRHCRKNYSHFVGALQGNLVLGRLKLAQSHANWQFAGELRGEPTHVASNHMILPALLYCLTS